MFGFLSRLFNRKEKAVKVENFCFEEVPEVKPDYSLLSVDELNAEIKSVDTFIKELTDIQCQAARSGMFGTANLSITNQIGEMIDRKRELQNELNSRL